MWITLLKTFHTDSTNFPPSDVEKTEAIFADVARLFHVFHNFHSPYYYNSYLNITFFSLFSE